MADIDNIIQDLNSIKYLHKDLFTLVVEFSDIYFAQEPDKKQFIDSLFSDPYFIEQSVEASREAMVLGVHGLILDQSVDFLKLIKGVTHPLEEKANLDALQLNAEDKEIVFSFLKALRREIFSRIFSQNKTFNQVTDLKRALIKKRYDTFLAYFSEI